MAKAISSKSNKVDTIISLKVTLNGSKPPIWRRILVPATINLGALSAVIRRSMGWTGGHMHSFTVADEVYGRPDELEAVADEKRATLGSFVRLGIKRFLYTYDFGDDWEHIVAIEKVEPASPGQSYPVCTAGKRRCPPEDCGGIWGYAELLEILADPAHPERNERLDWIDEEDFDPEEFDIALINQYLASFSSSRKKSFRAA